jgi:transposase
LAKELVQLGRRIAAHLRAFPALGDKVRRLMTVKGVGLVTAATAIAELPAITADTDTRAICSWVGLTPRRRQSGRTELPTRLSRHGNAYLRDALFMPALVAKRWNPLLRDFAQRLSDRGKSPNAILGAVSHKLLRILVGLLRSNRDFDPHWSTEKI